MGGREGERGQGRATRGRQVEVAFLAKGRSVPSLVEAPQTASQLQRQDSSASAWGREGRLWGERRAPSCHILLHVERCLDPHWSALGSRASIRSDGGFFPRDVCTASACLNDLSRWGQPKRLRAPPRRMP